MIARPFASGPTAADLADGLTMAARVIFQQIVYGCLTPDCFVDVGDPTDPDSCSGFQCRPDELIANVAGVSREEELLGMLGLLPAVETDSEFLHHTILSGNGTELRVLLERGRVAVLGLEPSGSYSNQQIHFLSVACSVLQSEGENYGLFAECTKDMTRSEFASLGSARLGSLVRRGPTRHLLLLAATRHRARIRIYYRHPVRRLEHEFDRVTSYILRR